MVLRKYGIFVILPHGGVIIWLLFHLYASDIRNIFVTASDFCMIMN